VDAEHVADSGFVDIVVAKLGNVDSSLEIE
jgi:hypothetical protein